MQLHRLWLGWSPRIGVDDAFHCMSVLGMGFTRLASAALIAVIAAGCSSPTVDVPSPSLQTAPPATAPAATAPPSTTPTAPTTPEISITVTGPDASVSTTSEATSVPVTQLAPPDVIGPSPDDLEALFAATIRSDEVQHKQLYLPPESRDRTELLTVMTPIVADAVLSGYASNDMKHRRFEKGSIDSRAVLRMENYQAIGTAEVVLCWRNNGSEFDTKGTPDPADDTLVQNEVETVAYRVQMTKVGQTWKRSAVERETGEACTGAFS